MSDPQVPGRAWAGLADDYDGYVLRSDDGGLALTVRQYMRPRNPAPGQSGQVSEVVKYTFVREGISYGLYSVEPVGG